MRKPSTWSTLTGFRPTSPPKPSTLKPELRSKRTVATQATVIPQLGWRFGERRSLGTLAPRLLHISLWNFAPTLCRRWSTRDSNYRRNYSKIMTKLGTEASTLNSAQALLRMSASAASPGELRFFIRMLDDCEIGFGRFPQLAEYEECIVSTSKKSSNSFENHHAKTSTASHITQKTYDHVTDSTGYLKMLILAV